MVPTWLANILQRLPGHPAYHVYALMVLVFVLTFLGETVFPFLSIVTMAFGGYFLLILDWEMNDKEIVDLRDWLVVRVIASTFLSTLILSSIASALHRELGWWEYLIIITGLFILWRRYRIYTAIFSRVWELDSWASTQTVFRSREEDM